MGGNKLMGIAVILLGIALIVLGVGMEARKMNTGTTTNGGDKEIVKPYNETIEVELID